MSKNLIASETEFVLAAALAKCGNMHEAEDLTQETLLAALLYVEKGGVVENPRAFLSTLLTRKYYDRLRQKYRLPTVSIGEGFDIADDTNVAEELVKREEAEQVRREVAYLTESYRAVIVKHYFHGESVRDIAAQLNLPEGTVKSRLDFGRKQMKKGFEKMEKYQENSYMPKYLAVRNSGGFGINGEPMSLTEGDTLAQNLLILAYERPISVSDLSKAIGVAAAYVEPVVNRLVDGELMKRMGDGKVYTDFIIYHAEDHVKYIREAEAFAADHIEAFAEPLKEAIRELRESGFHSMRLERFMMMDIAQCALYESMESVREQKQVFPQRPNGGSWIAFATIFPQNYKIPADKQGKEEYSMSGKRGTYIDSYLGAKRLVMCNFETSLYPFSRVKLEGFGMNEFTEVEHNLLKFFYLLKKGIKPEDVDLDTRILQAIPLLEERGFITTRNGEPELLIPVLSREEEKMLYDMSRRAKNAFAEAIRPHLAEWCRTHKKEIPPHLTGVPDQKRTMPYEPSAMMFVYEAIRLGIHPRELGYPCPETIVIFD
jgi:RNA polymerase sigma-70 factor (ECF subfamily)